MIKKQSHNNFAIKTVFSCFLLLLVSSVQAEVYRWQDASGQVHFSDQKQQVSLSNQKNMSTLQLPQQSPTRQSAGAIDLAEIKQVNRFCLYKWQRERRLMQR